MGGQLAAADILDVEHEKGQAPFLCDGGVQLPEGPCRAVSGIGEGLFPQKLLFFIDSLKRCLRHIDLAAQLQVFDGPGQLYRHVRDHLCVGGHVFPEAPAVASCDGRDQLPVFIAQRHGQPVDLRLHQEGGVFPQFFPAV